MNQAISNGITGKVIVITGASSGIGACLAKGLHSKGAKVVISARRVEELQKVADDPQRILVHRIDVTKRIDHESLRDAAIAKFGKIDCWVNNAGIGMSKPILTVTEEDVDLMININTKSVLFGMQTIVPYFKERKEGQVINVSSLLGRLPFVSFRAMYSASKAAMNSLTCNMRLDLQNEGFENIFIALFTPGVVATEFGLNAVGGGPDSRTLPGAQPVEEVVEVIMEMINRPDSAVDVYSRPNYKNMVEAYYSAKDVRSLESNPPFAIASATRK